MISGKRVDSQTGQSDTDGKDILAAIVDAAAMQALVPASVSPLARPGFNVNLEPPLYWLPNEMLSNITQTLSAKDIYSLLLVNKKLKEFVMGELSSRSSSSYRLLYGRLKEKKAVCDAKYQQVAVDIHNINCDVKNELVLSWPRPPTDYTKMSIVDNIRGFMRASMAFSCCLLMLGAFLGLISLIPSPNPGLTNEDRDTAKFTGLGAVFFIGVVVAMCLTLACYQFMRSCQPRYTLFTSGREVEKYNNALKNMEEAAQLLPAP